MFDWPERMKTCSFFFAGSATSPRTALKTKRRVAVILTNIRFFIIGLFLDLINRPLEADASGSAVDWIEGALRGQPFQASGSCN
jgi:hypothetical protein